MTWLVTGGGDCTPICSALRSARENQGVRNDTERTDPIAQVHEGSFSK